MAENTLGMLKARNSSSSVAPEPRIFGGVCIRDGNFDQNQGSGSVRFGGAMSSSSVRFD